MKKFLIGTKEAMTEIWNDEGKVEAVTLVKILPMKVVQVKTPEKDGYTAVQVAYGEQKESRINKAQLGHTKDLGHFKGFLEFKPEAIDGLTVGSEIAITTFTPGDDVTIVGTSKGKGFQGVVKRHGFGGGPRSHGQKHSEREPGSIGGGLRNKVPKGMRMAGRMGGDRITVKNLKVLHIDTENRVVAVKGALPGRRGSLIQIIG